MRLLTLVVVLAALAEVGSRGAGAESTPLEERPLSMPVLNMKLSDIRDTFDEVHNGHRHEAADIMAPRGTPVLAVEDGTIKKLFLSKPGGTTIYEFDPAEQYCYYYAHLGHYAANLREGMHVKRGETIAYVDSTGDADVKSPHLHFGITAIGPEKKWWGGTPINPYPILRAAYLRSQGRP